MHPLARAAAALLVLALAVPLAKTGTAAAAVPSQSGIAIVLHAPSVTLSAGQSTSALAQIGNATKTPVTLKLYPGYAVELDGGGYRLEGGGDASRWVRLSAYTVHVPADKVVDFSYKVTVPEHIAPGYYVFGIVSSFISKKLHGHSGKVGIVVDVNMENTAPIVIHVPGPATYGLKLSGWTVSWLGKPGYALALTLDNTGNAYEYVDAHVTLINGAKRSALGPSQLFLLAHAGLTLRFVIPAIDVGPATIAVVSATEPGRSVTASGHLHLAHSHR
jgi:hypothetical protein